MVATLPVARAVLSALHVMFATWSPLSFVASASANEAFTCILVRSASVMKPDDVVELEEEEEDDDAFDDELFPPPCDELLEAPDEDPTAPLTAVTVPAMGAVSTVPLTDCWAVVTAACAEVTWAEADASVAASALAF